MVPFLIPVECEYSVENLDEFYLVRNCTAWRSLKDRQAVAFLHVGAIQATCTGASPPTTIECIVNDW